MKNSFRPIVVAVLLLGSVQMAFAKDIVHDAEYYILESRAILFVHGVCVVSNAAAHLPFRIETIVEAPRQVIGVTPLKVTKFANS